MSTIDYVYRFDPSNPDTKPHPADAETARRMLEEGNRTFARWMAHCRSAMLAPGEASQYVVPCNGPRVGMAGKPGGIPRQSPFAVVVGCSDARVPGEMLFGQGFNELFTIRVAGNVLGDVCEGSIDFALMALHESVRCLVVLGHRGCGAVKGAVDAYLQPGLFWSESVSHGLRAIFQQIFNAVREAANGLKEVWGSGAGGTPGYREALIESAVAVNAAQTAFDLRECVARSGRHGIEVLYAVYDTSTHQVCMPPNPSAAPTDEAVRLAPAPADPREFTALAVQMAQILKPAPGRPVAAG
jgi:carbonic anhydrase